MGKKWFEKITNQESFKIGLTVGIMLFLVQAMNEIIVIIINQLGISEELTKIFSNLTMSLLLFLLFSSLIKN